MERGRLRVPFRVIQRVCLISLLSLTFSFLFVERVHADEATISVEPPELTVQAFEVFTVDINVSNVVDNGGLYAYEFRVRFRNDTLKLISATRPSGHFLEPVRDPLNYFTPIWKLQANEGNETFQVAHFGYTLLAPEEERPGSGMLVRLEFVGFKKGSTEIDLFETKMVSARQIIWHIAKDGYVTVVPCVPDPNQDGIVDIFDLVMISLSFGSDFNSPNWNPNADINKDGVIDIIDLTFLSKNFGQLTGY